MKLRHVVITAVARDDIADGGAEHFRQTIEAVRRLNPESSSRCWCRIFNESDAAIERCWPRTRTFSIITSKPCAG